MKKILISAVAVALIVPQVAMAAWWNPFTWRIFSSPAEVRVEQAHDVSVESIKATTTATSISVISQQKETTTKKITKETLAKKPSTSPPNVATSKFPSFSVAVDVFFATPNLVTLRGVCEQSKNVPTGDTKDVLSADKLTIQKIPYSFYDEFKEMCDLLDRADIKFADVTPDSFSLVLSDNDSDSMRVAKLKSNDFMKIPNSYAVFYLYSADEQERKYINEDLSISCPPQGSERFFVVENITTHKIYAPVIYLLGKLSSSRMINVLGVGLSEKGKSRLSKVGVGWVQNIPFYGICGNQKLLLLQ